MELLELNAVSTLSGIAAVVLAAYLRLHWPFRYQYIAAIFASRPERLIRWLDISYRRNRSRVVGLLDKSTREIVAGNYDLAETAVAEGLALCREFPSLFHQAMIPYLFCNLSLACFYRGRYRDALELAFRVYERDQSLDNALGVIVCSHARLGDIQGAVEAYRALRRRRTPRTELRLFCLAEIEAAKGDYEKALAHLVRLSALRYTISMHLTQSEIHKRLQEWTKASAHVG